MNTDIFHNRFLETIRSRTNYDLFGSDNHEDIHWGKLFVHLFNEYFSKYIIRQKFNTEELVNQLIQHYSLPQSQILKIDRSKEEDIFQIEYSSSESLLILKEGFFIVICDTHLILMYGSAISEIERTDLLKIVNEYKIAPTVVKQFHMMQNSNGYFELADFDIKPFDINIETHYNDDFQNIHQLIINSLNSKDKNGLVLLHGKYGTGKTHYLRHLINTVDRKFIYFPLNMIEAISSPQFLPFMAEQSKAVLILEDCESLLVHRDTGLNNASALSNLLNLGDGLLSDALSINVICTFNAGLKKIDDAILRKGRLLARYEFKELELSKAQRLAKSIGKNISIDSPMTVSDIYNIEERNFENEPVRSVGFKVA